MVINYFRFVAAEVREILAALGARSLADIIGRTECLAVLPGATSKQRKLDLAPILAAAGAKSDAPRFCQTPRNAPFDRGELAERMVREMLPAITARSGGEWHYELSNHHRSIGARLSGEIARRWGNYGMEDAPIVVRCSGHAGQSFGVWNAGGLHLYLEGDANDYVGKGMAAGRIVLRHPARARFVARDTIIMGNTCLYGATGGELYAAGSAGERFAVRNSGAVAVLEGAGDHCCEYMTGGAVCVLGRTGVNFGAGFTGGFAYVLDEDGTFKTRCNMAMVDLEPMPAEEEVSERIFHHANDLESHGRVEVLEDMTRFDEERLHLLITRHARFTGSARAAEILADWKKYCPMFRKVMPLEYRRALAEMEKARTMQAAE